MSNLNNVLINMIENQPSVKPQSVVDNTPPIGGGSLLPGVMVYPNFDTDIASDILNVQLYQLILKIDFIKKLVIIQKFLTSTEWALLQNIPGGDLIAFEKFKDTFSDHDVVFFNQGVVTHDSGNFYPSLTSGQQSQLTYVSTTTQKGFYLVGDCVMCSMGSRSRSSNGAAASTNGAAAISTSGGTHGGNTPVVGSNGSNTGGGGTGRDSIPSRDRGTQSKSPLIQEINSLWNQEVCKFNTAFNNMIDCQKSTGWLTIEEQAVILLEQKLVNDAFSLWEQQFTDLNVLFEIVYTFYVNGTFTFEVYSNIVQAAWNIFNANVVSEWTQLMNLNEAAWNSVKCNC
jgi:hypothetical protein